MGVYLTLHVLNRADYNNRLLPAYHAFFKSGDLRPILQLIEEAKAGPSESQDNSDFPALDECGEILDRFVDGKQANLQATVDWGNGMRRSLTDIVRFNV
jgi:hypothetical protein